MLLVIKQSHFLNLSDQFNINFFCKMKSTYKQNLKKSNVSKIIDDYSDIRRQFLFMLPNIYSGNEENICILIEIISEYPFLKRFIDENIDINKFVPLLTSKNVNPILIKFVAFLIDELYDKKWIFEALVYFTQHYFRMNEIQKDFIRLLFINFSTCDLKLGQYNIVITFLNNISTQIFHERKEILDALRIIEILTSTLFLVPEHSVEIIKQIFEDIIKTFFQRIEDDSEFKSLLFAIYANFLEEGHQLCSINILENILSDDDVRNSNVMYEYLRAIFACGEELVLEVENYDDLSFKLKSLITSYYEIEEDGDSGDS